MKKYFLIAGTLYMGVCLGVGIWMLFKPESYGKWCMRLMNGMFGEEEI